MKAKGKRSTVNYAKLKWRKRIV